MSSSVLEERFSSATARLPLANGFTHTSPEPIEESRRACWPAGSWSIAIASLLVTVVWVALDIEIKSSLIISGAASIAQMLNCVRNCAADIPWSGPR